MDPVDLLSAFTSGHGFETMMNALLPALNNANSAAAAVLALEGLFRIEENVHSGQFIYEFNVREGIREFLRKWRCESPLDQAYGGAYGRAKTFLRSLTIFETLQVPLFIDDYGKKRLMSHYMYLVDKHKQTRAIQTQAIQTMSRQPVPVSIDNIDIEVIHIDLDTPIVHVTHTEQKDSIVANQMFIPSSNKNSIEGVWFAPKSQLLMGNPPLLQSVYGNWAFETTLRSLGVAAPAQVVGIRQGETVSYKDEVNFILYASDTVPPWPVTKATDSALRLFECNPNAYGVVSIFVPSRFLPQVPQQRVITQQRVMPQQVFMPQQLFMQGVNTLLYQIDHRRFCVKEKRNIIPICEELIRF
ncbi:Hypothetical predicted protein [Paramuricea clavata]|uniref:Uncharacterized protein n=1 Tax=Paramuricea clavata TaxID=317549 RepID=A0A7D9HNN0_PARCT|nr:Hypothetical predicted protein [Paramuricea clavata]